MDAARASLGDGGSGPDVSDEARVTILTGELRETEEALRCSELKAASMESLLESLQAELETLRRTRASDKKKLRDIRSERERAPESQRVRGDMLRIGDAAEALKAQQAVMLAVQERRLLAMDGALHEMNAQLKRMQGLCAAHGIGGGGGGGNGGGSSVIASPERLSTALTVSTPPLSSFSSSATAREPTPGRDLLRAELRKDSRSSSLVRRSSAVRQPIFTPAPAAARSGGDCAGGGGSSGGGKVRLVSPPPPPPPSALPSRCGSKVSHPFDDGTFFPVQPSESAAPAAAAAAATGGTPPPPPPPRPSVADSAGARLTMTLHEQAEEKRSNAARPSALYEQMSGLGSSRRLPGLSTPAVRQRGQKRMRWAVAALPWRWCWRC